MINNQFIKAVFVGGSGFAACIGIVGGNVNK